MSHRLAQINELIQRELSQIISREIDFAEGILVTIVGVETSPDLEKAKIWLSIFPIQKSKEVIKFLNKKIGYLQGLLNRRLVMRPLPRIKFLIDKTEAKAAEIENLLNQIKKSK